MNSKYRQLVIVCFVVTMGFIGIMMGALFTKSSIAFGKDRYGDLQLFTKVLNLVEQHYVEEVDIKKLIYGGIKGMLASLDPHTNFLPPDIFKEFKVETSGEFGGVGIEISLQDDVLTVLNPIEDTPAWKAGVKSGDKIIEIQGKSTKGMSLAEAVNIMRGKRGSEVTLTIFREGFEKAQKFTMARDIIRIKSVKNVDLGGGYLYLRITSFIERTGDDLVDAIDKFEKKNGKLNGVVLDLRNNAGGLLDQAIKVVNEFVDEGIIVSTMGRNKKNKDIVYAKKDGARTDFPVVVLVNEYSASASEIVAGALQDHKRAAIMGQRTFGKGSVQSVVELGDGAGLKLTVARYYTPSGRSIQAHGIEPDIKIDAVDTEAYEKAVVKRRTTREADIEGHLVNESDEEKVEEKPEDKPPKNKEALEVWKKMQQTKKSGKETEKEVDESKLSPSEKLLRKDYQASQAYNYLKAWVVFKSMGQKLPMNKSDEKAEGDGSATDGTQVAPGDSSGGDQGEGAESEKAPNVKAEKPANKSITKPGAKSGGSPKPAPKAPAVQKAAPSENPEVKPATKSGEKPDAAANPSVKPAPPKSPAKAVTPAAKPAAKPSVKKPAVKATPGSALPEKVVVPEGAK